MKPATTAHANTLNASRALKNWPAPRRFFHRIATAGGPVGARRKGARRRLAGRARSPLPARRDATFAAWRREDSRLASSKATSDRTTHRKCSRRMPSAVHTARRNNSGRSETTNGRATARNGASRNTAGAEPATRPAYRPKVAGLSHSAGPGVGTAALTQCTASAASAPTTASTSNRRRQSVSPRSSSIVRANEEPSRCRLMVERMIQ